jgi:formate dehydrogenase major subunit
LDREGSLHWPCRDTAVPGDDVLHLERFATATGRAALAACRWLPPGEVPDADYPFVLVTGRRLEHYNAGTMTRRTANAELVAREVVELNPSDAERIGITDGARVELASRRAAIELAAAVNDRVAPGQLFMSFHFPDALANALTSDVGDDVTACPEYKVTAVALRTLAKQ